MSSERLLSGVVSAFDPVSGLGQVDVGALTLEFHCVEISDGTRQIDPGAAVWCRARRKFGRLEAADLRLRPV